MARIIVLDQSFPFDGTDLRTRALGGVQGATVMLAEALAARGHRVMVATAASGQSDCHGVSYRPLAEAGTGPVDLAIANRVPILFDHVTAARPAAKALWLHGPASYLAKPRHWWPLLRHRPVPVFLGHYHSGTRPRGIPLRVGPEIPHGIGTPFVDAPISDQLDPPPPRAVFASNPRRGLDWLCDLWSRVIRPQVPGAELHVFAGSATYGDQADPKLEAALTKIAAHASNGVILRQPVPKPVLAEEWRQARVMLYRGDPGETFCFAAAEAQAMGVPLVTAGIGALRERVIDRVTGFLEPDPAGFAAAAIRLLTDDTLWRLQHRAAIASRTRCRWDERAAAWERHFLT